MRTALLLAIAVLLSPARLVAQDSGTASVPSIARARPRTGRPVYVWIGAGVGASSAGYGGSANLSLQYGATVVSLRTAEVTDAPFWSREDFSDVGVLFGVGTVGGEFSHASVAAGIAKVSGTLYGYSGSFFSTQDPRRADTTSVGPNLGLPFEVQGFFQAGVIGIGLYVYGDINSVRSFGGVSLYVQVGKLR